MKLIIGKSAGFCHGVKRAVEGAELQTVENNKIYCLGELVHNKQVIKKLEQKGIKCIDNIEEMDQDTNYKENKIIIRAHGIPKEIYIKAKEKQIDVVDFTCPHVLKIHKIVEKYSEEGYFIFVIGMKNHPETIGTKSFCGRNYKVISDENMIEEGIKEFKTSGIKKVLLIVQTTFSVEKFNKIKVKIERNMEKDTKIVVKNTICLATAKRQKETEKISKKVECMIIIGGKNSSNTKKLYEIAQMNCKRAIQIETKEELKEYDFGNIKTIGIMAGASTPESSIKDVILDLNVEICDEK